MFSVCSKLSLALKIHISDADLYCFLCYVAFLSTQLLHFRCGSVMFSGCSERSLAFQIRIFDADELSIVLNIRILAADL